MSNTRGVDSKSRSWNARNHCYWIREPNELSFVTNGGQRKGAQHGSPWGARYVAVAVRTRRYAASRGNRSPGRRNRRGTSVRLSTIRRPVDTNSSGALPTATIQQRSTVEFEYLVSSSCLETLIAATWPPSDRFDDTALWGSIQRDFRVQGRLSTM